MGAQPCDSLCLEPSGLLEQDKQPALGLSESCCDQGKALMWQIPLQTSTQEDSHTTLVACDAKSSLERAHGEDWLCPPGPARRADNLRIKCLMEQ